MTCFLKRAIHFIQESQVNVATLRPNGIQHSTVDTPISSTRQLPSTTTTTTTPAVKSNFKKVSIPT